MAETFKINLTGFNELRKILSEIPDDIAKKAGIDALRSGAKPILEEAKRLVPRRTGKLAESLEIKTKKGRFPIVKVQASRKKGGYHAHLVELGTKPHTIENVVLGGKFYSKVEHKGSSKNPFLRPAFNSQKENALKKILTEIGGKIANRLKREMKK